MSASRIPRVRKKEREVLVPLYCRRAQPLPFDVGFYVKAGSSTYRPGAAAMNVSSIAGWPPASAAPPRYIHQSTRETGKAIEEVSVVLAVMAVLGIVASVVGRLCGGRHLGGDSPFDFEGWVEKRCAGCLDGDLEEEVLPPPPEAEGTHPPPAPPIDGEAPAPQGEAVPPPPADLPPAPPVPPSPPGGVSMAMAPVVSVAPCHHFYYPYPAMASGCHSHHCCKDGYHHYHPRLPYG